MKKAKSYPPLVLLSCGLLSLTACWWLTVTMAIDFYALPNVAEEWNRASLSILFLMWSIMMAAMMLPSALPFLQIFHHYNIHRNITTTLPTIAVAGGYLLWWGMFSLLAALFHHWCNQQMALDNTMALASSDMQAGLLALAGVYQFTNLKHACLRGCRSAPFFIMLHWRRGVHGAFFMGARHGLYCVGCCWALMLLLFVGGVMDLRWIIALTLYVIIEKLIPAKILSYAIGGGLIIAAIIKLTV